MGRNDSEATSRCRGRAGAGVSHRRVLLIGAQPVLGGQHAALRLSGARPELRTAATGSVPVLRVRQKRDRVRSDGRGAATATAATEEGGFFRRRLCRCAHRCGGRRDRRQCR